MKAILRFLFILSISAVAARADGIPVDRKTHQVMVPHTVLKLSDSQSEEIETLGTLTLSPEQWQKLRAIGSGCPKRIQYVLPVTWTDCTCDIGTYAIQLSRSQVALTHGHLTEAAASDFEYELAQLSDFWLRADRHGQFYHNGVLIPFTRLVEKVAAVSGRFPADAIKQSRSLGVELPLGMSRNSAVVKSRLDKLFEAARNAGWQTPDDKQ